MILHIVVTIETTNFYFYDAAQPFKKKTCDYKIVTKKEPYTHAILVDDMREKVIPSEIIVMLIGDGSMRFVKFNYKPITS